MGQLLGYRLLRLVLLCVTYEVEIHVAVAVALCLIVERSIHYRQLFTY